MDILKNRYQRYFKDEVYEESFSTDRPQPESGYKVVRQKIRSKENPKKLVMGYKKVRVSKSAPRKSSLSKSQRHAIAIKSWHKKHANPRQLKLSTKRAIQTRKANK